MYSDFRKYLVEKYPSYNYEFDGILESVTMPDGDEQYDMDDLIGSIISAIDNCAGETWGNLEASIGIDYANNVLAKTDWFFNDVDWNEEDDDEIKNSIYNNQDNAESVTNGFIKIRELFNEWVFEILAQIDFKKVKKIRKPSFRDALFLNFNYTSTIEDLYKVPVNRVCHIHGFAKDSKSEILFGHRTEENLQTPSSFFGIQDAFNSLVEFMEKDTAGAIKRNQRFFNKLYKINRIYSFGFSFSDVDMCYIDEISRRVNPKKVKWYFNKYDWNNNLEYIEKIRKYGYKIRKCHRW